MIEHCSELEIQQYATDRRKCPPEVSRHMKLCDSCRGQAETYRIIFDGIKAQPRPDFHFDLSGSVMKQLTQTRHKSSFDRVVNWIMIAVPSVLAGMALYIMRIPLSGLYTGVSKMGIILAIVCVISLLVFLVIDMYRSYRKKIKTLNSV